MDKLKVDWEQEKPEGLATRLLWDLMRINSVEEWSKAADVLKEKIGFTHANERIQLHKYSIESTVSFDWFAARNRLDEINFIEKLLKRDELAEYRAALQIPDKQLIVKVTGFRTDIYDLPSELARILGQGGAYQNLDAQTAWSTAVEFVKDEFQDRFDEVTMSTIEISSANWFYNIAWDYSVFLFDKRNYEVTLIDITDTD